MVKHGLSHAGASLVSLAVGQVLAVEILSYVPQLQGFIRDYVGPLLVWAEIPLSTDMAARVLLVALFGFLWGVAFRILNSNGKAG